MAEVESVQSKRLQRIYENAKKSLSIETQVHIVGPTEPTTMYRMDISFKSTHNKWSIVKRYSEFFHMRRTLKKFHKHFHAQLVDTCPLPLQALETALAAPFPRRHLRTDNHTIIAERKRALEAFVQLLVKVISCIPLSDSTPIHAAVEGEDDDAVSTTTAATAPSPSTSEKDGVAVLYQLLRDFLEYPDRQIESETKLKLAVLSLEDVIVDSSSASVESSPMLSECCSICLGDWQDAECAGMNVVKLPCMHAFHEECLMEWLQSNSHCPMCRDEPTPTAVAEAASTIGSPLSAAYPSPATSTSTSTTRVED